MHSVLLLSFSTDLVKVVQLIQHFLLHKLNGGYLNIAEKLPYTLTHITSFHLLYQFL